MTSWLLAVALAGPEGDLLVEQSRRALLQDRPDEARVLAVTSLRSDPEAWGAWRLYLRASKATGLGAVAEAELEASDDPAAALALAWWRVSSRRQPIESLEPLAAEDPRAAVALGWSLLSADRAAEALALTLPDDEPLAAKLHLRALAARGRTDERDEAGLAWLEAQPQHPDVLAELWGRNDASPKVQKRVLKALRKRIEAGEDDPRWLLLALRTLIAADAPELAGTVADRLEASGMERPLTRNGWGPTMRKAMGRALAGHDTIALPPTTPAERAGMAASLADTLVSRDRIDDAVVVWSQVRKLGDSWSSALGHGRALRAAGDEEGAQEAFAQAMEQTLSPWPFDPCGLDLAQRAQVASQIAEAAQAAGGPALAWPEPLTAALGGDMRPWRDLTTDPLLTWCLSTATDTEAEAPEGAAVDPAKAADALHAAYEASLALVPSDLTHRSARLPQPGEMFPDIPLAMSDGASTLADHRGRPVLLSLWASWCAPCRKELPQLDAKVAALAEEGVALSAFAVSIDDDERPYRRALQRLPLGAVRLGRDPSVATQLGATSLPATWLVGPDGKVLLMHVGYDPELPARVEEAIRAIPESP